MSEKIKRTITSIFYFILIISVVIINKYEYTLCFVFLQAVCAIYEIFNVADLKKSVLKYFGYLVCLAYFLSGMFFKNTHKYLKDIILITFLFSVIYTILRNKKVNFKEFVFSNFTYIYIPFLLSFIPEMFNLKYGNILYLFLMFTVMSTDACAYIVGSKFGKNKLISISPKKSVEGSLGGTIASIITIFLTYLVFAKINIINQADINIYLLILFTFILSILSQFGDLIASYIKRYFNKKDYGKILMGHGGILDRIDSLILTAPIAYLLFKTFLI